MLTFHGGIKVRHSLLSVTLWRVSGKSLGRFGYVAVSSTHLYVLLVVVLDQFLGYLNSFQHVVEELFALSELLLPLLLLFYSFQLFRFPAEPFLD